MPNLLTRFLRALMAEPPRAQVAEIGIADVRPKAEPQSVDVNSLPPPATVVPVDFERLSDVYGRPVHSPRIFGGRFVRPRRADAADSAHAPAGPDSPVHRATAARPRTDRPQVEEPPAEPVFDLQALWPLLLPTPRSLAGNDLEFGIDIPHPLYAFQADGVRFLVEQRQAALLADDMGLGKTVQAITAARVLIRRGYVLTALVVLPKSVAISWVRHVADWAPELRCIALQGSPRNRRHMWDSLRRRAVHIGIATYDTVRRDMADGLVPPVDLLIADEIQNIKNPSAKRSVAMREISAEHRWGLTGTPLENSLDELTAILRFIDPATMAAANLVSLHSVAKQLMLRRKKEEVLKDLPDLLTSIEYIELTPEQHAAYKRAETEGINELEGKPRNIANVLTLITRLKQICNGVNGKSAKMEWLYDYAYTARDEGDKLLVFSQYLDTLSEVERDLTGLQPLKYTGALNDRERTQRIDAFQAERSRHYMMLLQTRAGGVGVTLTAANRVVHFDSWWNPAVQSQATARAHRIGQKKAVFEVTLVSVNTIEERIQELLASKRELFDRAINDLSVEGVARLLTRDELYGLFDLAA